MRGDDAVPGSICCSSGMVSVAVGVAKTEIADEFPLSGNVEQLGHNRGVRDEFHPCRFLGRARQARSCAPRLRRSIDHLRHREASEAVPLLGRRSAKTARWHGASSIPASLAARSAPRVRGFCVLSASALQRAKLSRIAVQGGIVVDDDETPRLSLVPLTVPEMPVRSGISAYRLATGRAGSAGHPGARPEDRAATPERRRRTRSSLARRLSLGMTASVVMFGNCFGTKPARNPAAATLGYSWVNRSAASSHRPEKHAQNSGAPEMAEQAAGGANAFSPRRNKLVPPSRRDLKLLKSHRVFCCFRQCLARPLNPVDVCQRLCADGECGYQDRPRSKQAPSRVAIAGAAIAKPSVIPARPKNFPKERSTTTFPHATSAARLAPGGSTSMKASSTTSTPPRRRGLARAGVKLPVVPAPSGLLGLPIMTSVASPQSSMRRTAFTLCPASIAARESSG